MAQASASAASAWVAGQLEQARDHGLHLFLGRLAVADHGLLDLQRVYSATGSFAVTSAAIAAPRAWPSSSVDCGLTLTKTISTAACCGW
jgi:hypothetical protein